LNRQPSLTLFRRGSFPLPDIVLPPKQNARENPFPCSPLKVGYLWSRAELNRQPSLTLFRRGSFPLPDIVLPPKQNARENPFPYSPLKVGYLWSRAELNRQPSACEADALPLSHCPGFNRPLNSLLDYTTEVTTVSTLLNTLTISD
jgi:hypothetical protein